VSWGDKVKVWITLCTSLLLFIADVSANQSMRPVEIYAKCYLRLTDQPVDVDSGSYTQVKSGQLDPVEACTALLDRATFVNQGGQRRLADPEDKVAVSLVQNFQQFHESWFSSFGDRFEPRTRMFHAANDYSEPALFITDSLLGGFHYRSIFRRNTPLRGVRQGPSSPQYVVAGLNLTNRFGLIGPVIGGGNSSDTSESNFIEYFPSSTVSMGELIGIETAPAVMAPEAGTVYRSEIRDADLNGTREDDSEVNLTQHHGGGILGSKAYVSMNTEAVNRLNGGDRVHRRYANNTFFDLLCLTLPTLRNEDVTAYLNRYSQSELPYRRDVSCARCHATMDPFADGARNLMVSQFAANTFTNNVREAHPSKLLVQFDNIKPYKVRVTSQSNDDVDLRYHRRAPRAHLFYRNYNGQLVNEQVTGLSALGTAISNQDDPYICAAQRYYHFLTGVQIPVQMSDPADVDSRPEFYRTHRNEIVRLGTELKEHGSLKRMITDILRTDAFQTRFPGLTREEGGQ
jgi:hypothetical protein